MPGSHPLDPRPLVPVRVSMPFPSPHSHSPSFLPSIAVGPVAVPSFLQSSLFLHLVLTYSLFSFPSSRFSPHRPHLQRQVSKASSSAIRFSTALLRLKADPSRDPFTTHPPLLTRSLAASRTSGGSSNFISKCRRND